MDSVETFIATHIHTVEELEILLLLHRSPETFWSIDAIAQHLSLKTDLVASLARALAARSLLRVGESGPNFRFAPGSPAFAEEMGRVAAAYRDRRMSLIHAIDSAGLGPLRSFADAFKIGGKKES